MKVGDLVRDKIYDLIGVVASIAGLKATGKVKVHWATDPEIITYFGGTPVLHLEVIN